MIPLPFNERKFLINYGKHDLKCVKLVDEFIKELLGFGVIMKTNITGDMTGTIKFESVKAHDDIVMSCALGYYACALQTIVAPRIFRGSSNTQPLLIST